MLTLHFARKSCVGLALVLAALVPRAAAQNTYYVDVNGIAPGTGSPADPYTSIQRAITASGTQAGDTIRVRPGVYHERLDFNHGLNVVSENGPDQTIIDADYRSSVVTIRNRVGWPSLLEGFTLRHGSGRYNPVRGESLGGGLFVVNSNVVLVNCTITENATKVGGFDSELQGRGGGIYAGVDAELLLLGCTVSANDAVDGGGIFIDRGSLAMDGGNVIDNRALGFSFLPGRGGGILAGGRSTLDLYGVHVDRNLALGNFESPEALGGGIRLEASSRASIDNCTISENDSGGFSLGYGDLSGYGGGVSSMARATDFTMTSTDITGNWGNNGGGGVHGRGRLENCTIEENHGQFGGGVAAVDIELYDCVLRSNWGGVSGSYDWGGGIYVAPGLYGRLERCELDSNHAFGQGGGGWGGIYVDCDIHDNLARGDGTVGYVLGGGVMDGDLVDCRVWNNTSFDYEDHSAFGGGLYGGSALRTVFHHNSADLAGGAASSAVLERCTVVFNSDGAAHDCTIRNSIVRFNTLRDVIDSVVSWSNVPADILGTGNISADPMFQDVFSNDYRLQAGSPCIDAGDPTSPPDPDGSRADMGAIPFGG